MVMLCAATSLLGSCIRLQHLPERIGTGTRALFRVSYASDDGSAFINSTIYDLPSPREVKWVQVPITIIEFGHRTPGVFLSVHAACEVFWDGQPLGTTRLIDTFLPLTREQASKGEHVLLLRVHPASAPTGSWLYGIGLGDYNDMVRSRIVSQIIPMIGAGAFVVAAAWYLAMWISMRRRMSVLVFAVLCCAAALLDFTEGYRAMFNYGFEWHIVRLRAIFGLTLAVCVLLPLFLVLEMGIRRVAWLAAAFVPLLAVAALSSSSYDGASLTMFSLSMIACIAIVASARPRKRWEALPAAIGVAILTAALAAGGYRFGDRGFFFAFSILIVALLVSLSIDLGREQRVHHATTLRAARLEAELLKKSIHPHFIMNTLTAVMEWIEENPKQGVRFLESLADELRLFLDVASRPLIPLQKELALCNAHLRIMSCRKAMQFELETTGVNGDKAVPPAIFHTLVENAISHNSYDDATVSFRLREERAGESRRYIFSAPLSTRQEHDGGGVGMRYVKTRLEDSYPGRWSVQSFADGDWWQTSIEVPA